MDEVDLDARDENGQTPLHLAVECGMASIVKLLLETDRVNPNAKGINGQTLILRAAEMGYWN